MWKIYLKQAWAMLRQNRLFSSIYVVGTGLSIALTMTVFIIFYVKTAPIYPEYNRDRTVVLKYLKWYPADQPDNWHGNGFSLDVADLLDGVPHLEAMAQTCENVPMYNPQNEMFRLFKTKCSNLQNETYLCESFFSPL